MSVWNYYDVKLCRIKLRTDLGFEVKSECLAIDGLEIKLRAEWRIDDDDRRYPNEWALVPVGLEDLKTFPVTWIASGDVEIIQGA